MEGGSYIVVSSCQCTAEIPTLAGSRDGCTGSKMGFEHLGQGRLPGSSDARLPCRCGHSCHPLLPGSDARFPAALRCVQVILLSDGSVTRHLQLMTNQRVEVCLAWRRCGVLMAWR